MDKRTVLAIFLSLVLVMGYQYFFKPENAEKLTETTQSSQEQRADVNGEAGDVKTVVSSSPQKIVFDKGGEEVALEKEIVVDSSLYTAVFSTKGAGLKSFKLKKYNQEIAENSGLIELVNVKNGMALPLSVSFPDSSVTVPDDVHYNTETDSVDMTNIAEAQTLSFVRTFADAATIEKIYTFYPDKYAFDVEVRVKNLSSNAYKQDALLSWHQYVDPEVKSSRYSHDGPISLIGDDVESENVKKMSAREVKGPDVSWGGFESKYFVAAMIPEKPSLTSLVLSKDSGNQISTSLKGPSSVILPGQSGVFRYRLYIGPKDYDTLKAENAGLENSINLGSWVKWLSLPLLTVLKYIHQYIPNYGVAIIILTIFIKMIFWPLGSMSYKSMKNMQKLQPQMQQLRERYGNDKARLNQEIMALYKTNKVNPMGGCFPIAIQLPVFFGLYRALLYSIELRHSPFMFWIQDLSAKDPYYITPIVMGATMLLQQKMSPTPGGNEMQAKMMMWMPVIFTFLFLSFPSGLVIYWLFNNILSIGQQYFINKRPD